MTPSEQAKKSQFDYGDHYPGIDNWQDSSLHNGNIIYIWEADGQTSHGGGNAYAMTPDTALGCNGDPNQLQSDLQTALNPAYDTHRGHLQAYEVKGDVPAAYSHVEANPCHGAGGGEQYFVPNFDSELANGNIVKRDDLNLDFNKDMLPIDEIKIAQDQKNTSLQPPEPTSTPSQGTTPTLDGAYQGPTPNKAEELKPQVDTAQKEWDKKTPSESASSNNDNSNKINSQTVESLGGGGARAPSQSTRGEPPKENPIPKSERPLSGEAPKPEIAPSDTATNSSELRGTSNQNIDNSIPLENAAPKAGDGINNANDKLTGAFNSNGIT